MVSEEKIKDVVNQMHRNCTSEEFHSDEVSLIRRVLTWVLHGDDRNRAPFSFVRDNETTGRRG